MSHYILTNLKLLEIIVIKNYCISGNLPQSLESINKKKVYLTICYIYFSEI